MTDDEKELEEKMKQYQYEEEERKKKLEILENDIKGKKNKKSFIFKMNKTIGRVVLIWSSLGFIIVFGLLFFALSRFMGGLNNFDPVKYTENKYNINLKILSRDAEEKVLVYKVKPISWKYRKIECTVVREGMTNTFDDIDDKYLQYVIKKIETPTLLEGFEKREVYDEYGLLDYKLIYKSSNEDNKNVNDKIENIKKHILDYDKNINKIVQLNEKILKDDN